MRKRVILVDDNISPFAYIKEKSLFISITPLLEIIIPSKSRRDLSEKIDLLWHELFRTSVGIYLVEQKKKENRTKKQKKLEHIRIRMPIMERKGGTDG